MTIHVAWPEQETWRPLTILSDWGAEEYIQLYLFFHPEARAIPESELPTDLFFHPETGQGWISRELAVRGWVP